MEVAERGLQKLLAQAGGGGRGQLQLSHAVKALRAAGDDVRVRGVFAAIGPQQASLAQLQELRDGVAAFRQGGQTTIACCVTGADSRGHHWAAQASEHCCRCR